MSDKKSENKTAQLKIWNKKNRENATDGQLFLRLVIDEPKLSNDICLVVTDKSGKRIDRGSLLLIDDDLRCIVKGTHVSDKVRLKKDMLGAIRMLSVPEALAYVRSYPTVKFSYSGADSSGSPLTSLLSHLMQHTQKNQCSDKSK